MKLVIDIPKEFEDDFFTKGMFGAENKFVECFNRILSEIKWGRIPTCGLYENEIVEMFGDSAVILLSDLEHIFENILKEY